MKNGPYILIIPPSSYSGRRYRSKYAYEHHVNFWLATGEIPSTGMEIHHINGNHKDNRPENLMLLTASEHRKQHGKALREKHRIKIDCAFCQKPKTIKGNVYRSKMKSGQKKFYCSRNCHHQSMIRHGEKASQKAVNF